MLEKYVKNSKKIVIIGGSSEHRNHLIFFNLLYFDPRITICIIDKTVEMKFRQGCISRNILGLNIDTDNTCDLENYTLVGNINSVTSNIMLAIENTNSCIVGIDYKHSGLIKIFDVVVFLDEEGNIQSIKENVLEVKQFEENTDNLDTKELLANFSLLNKQGKEMVLTYTRDLADLKRYIEE